MMDIQLERVSMRFGDFTAVQDANLEIKAGEFFSFLGPSGCGKTTILRLVSGFIEPTEGAVKIGGEDMRGIGPNKRPTALIFQNLALFPLMTVWENIAYGLRVRGASRAEQRRRADEPLSALDLKLRQHMHAELRAIQKRTGVTFVYITHDQGEALTMSDRVGVMSAGVLEQVDTPSAIYNSPDTAFVATFVGENNPFDGRVVETDAEHAVVDTDFGRLRARNKRKLVVGDYATVFARPERCQLVNGATPDNVIATRVDRLDLEGSYLNLFLKGSAGRDIVVHLTNNQDTTHLTPGNRVSIGFGADEVVALPRGEMAKE